MSYLDRICACNTARMEAFIPLRVAGTGVGWVGCEFARHLAAWPDVFAVSEQTVDLHPRLDCFASRTQAIGKVTGELMELGIIDPRHGELYPATAGNHEGGLFALDRAAAPWFGIRAFGQHLNGFVRDGDEILVWVGKRARDKRTFPGKLDNMVAGGLPLGISLEDNLIKECHEEAGIPAPLAKQARPVGMIAYRVQTPRGLKPDVMYCYDLELPADFEPRCQDGEVEAFHLWPLAKVAQVVSESDAFKMNCDLVIIHFLIRHGYIGPDHPDYLQLTTGLSQLSGFEP